MHRVHHRSHKSGWGPTNYVMAVMAVLLQPFSCQNIYFQPCITHAAATYELQGTTMVSWDFGDHWSQTSLNYLSLCSLYAEFKRFNQFLISMGWPLVNMWYKNIFTCNSSPFEEVMISSYWVVLHFHRNFRTRIAWWTTSSTSPHLRLK